MNNISNKKTNEKNLSINSNHNIFRFIADESPNMIFINKKGKIVYVNKMCTDIMGYSKKEFLSKEFNFLKLIIPESVEKIKEAFKKHEMGMNIPPYEYKIITKKGKKIDVIINTKLIKYENEKAILGIVTDVSKLKKIENELKENKNYLQNIIDNTSEMIITIDKNHKIKTWNASAEKITGYKKSQVINKNVKGIDLFEFTSDIKDYMKSIAKNNPYNLKNLTLKTSKGKIIKLSTSTSHIKDENNNIKEIIFLCKDITQNNLISKKLQNGLSYIIDDINIDQALTIFFSYLEKNNYGLLISRQIANELIKNKNIKNYKLSLDRNEALSTIDNLNNLEKTIENNIKKHKTIILLDRIDFFISTFPFKEIIKTLYRINDLIKNYDSILILRINSKLLNESELSLFNEEYIRLKTEKIKDVIIRDDLIDIIQYINNENKMNLNVNYGDIGNKFDISKVTVKKRIETLIKKDLIYSKKIGNTKILYLTDHGKKLL